MQCREMQRSEPTVGKCNGLNLLHCEFIFADGTLRSEPPTHANNNPQPAHQSHRLNDDSQMQMKCHMTRISNSQRNAMARNQKRNSLPAPASTQFKKFKSNHLQPSKTPADHLFSLSRTENVGLQSELCNCVQTPKGDTLLPSDLT